MTAHPEPRKGDFSQVARQIVQEATRERDGEDETKSERDDARSKEQRDTDRNEATG